MLFHTHVLLFFQWNATGESSYNGRWEPMFPPHFISLTFANVTLFLENEGKKALQKYLHERVMDFRVDFGMPWHSGFHLHTLFS